MTALQQPTRVQRQVT